MQEAPRPRSRELRLLGLCWIFLLRNQRRSAAPPLPPPEGWSELRTLLRAPLRARGSREEGDVAAVERSGASHGEGEPGREELPAEGEAGVEGAENECCVCYEPRARLRQCRFCDARLSVCLPCLLAWRKSGGGDRRSSAEEQCILCKGPRGGLRISSRPSPIPILPEEEERWLTVYFLLFTIMQYLYLIWFVRNVLFQLVQLSIFDL